MTTGRRSRRSCRSRSCRESRRGGSRTSRVADARTAKKAELEERSLQLRLKSEEDAAGRQTSGPSLENSPKVEKSSTFAEKSSGQNAGASARIIEEDESDESESETDDSESSSSDSEEKRIRKSQGTGSGWGRSCSRGGKSSMSRDTHSSLPDLVDSLMRGLSFMGSAVHSTGHVLEDEDDDAAADSFDRMFYKSTRATVQVHLGEA